MLNRNKLGYQLHSVVLPPVDVLFWLDIDARLQAEMANKTSENPVILKIGISLNYSFDAYSIKCRSLKHFVSPE